MAKQRSGYYKVNVLFPMRDAVRSAVYRLAPGTASIDAQGDEHGSTQYAFLLYCHNKPTVPALTKLLRSYIGGRESDEGGERRGGGYSGWLAVREVTQKEMDEADAAP